MSYHPFRRRLTSALLACVAGTATLASPAQAGQVASNKLLEIMVTKGLVTREEADMMIAEANSAETAALAPVPAGGVAADGTQTIPYIPEFVRDQIKQELRSELATQAQTEGWAKPGEVPAWTKRISLYGDVRVRGEGRYYAAPVYDQAGLQVGGNYIDFVDWGKINKGSPFQANQSVPGYDRPPYVNTGQDRTRFRLRARLGLKAQIDDWISIDARLATGADESPISTNQTLGAGGTGKYQIWLDRASIKLTPMEDLTINMGRFSNPFWVSDLVYDNDMNFDGVAVSATSQLAQNVRLFGTAGAFPVFNTSMNFGSNDAGPFESSDKYLFAAQFGLEFGQAKGLRGKLAGSYFHYDGVEGRFSSPCNFDQDVCDTDYTRPSFQQFGNTMFALRNIVPDASVPQGFSPENQYFGLASKFEMLNVRGQVEYDINDRIGLRVEGDFVKNLGFNKSAAALVAQNNFGPATRQPDPTNPGEIVLVDGPYAGGDMGYQGRLTVGSLRLGMMQGDWQAQRGDWSAHIGYRRIESDAVIDGFADSDFGLGGTNSKGWFAGANYAVANNAVASVRWFSSDEVAGPALSVDRLFVDLMTKF